MGNCVSSKTVDIKPIQNKPVNFKLKKGFVKVFKNIDSLIKKINISLDLKNKIK